MFGCGRRPPWGGRVKGIAHFSVGVAAASCFPSAVAAGASGNPLYFILGAVCGLLPDTLDFKFYRFWYRHDIELAPDPLAPDPQQIADVIAGAVGKARREDRPCNLRLNTIRLGADRWRRYEIAFDVPGRKVAVRMGPVVDTGANIVESVEREEEGGEAPLPCGVRIDYEAVTRVDIFEGPLFRMVPLADGRVTPLFVAWHRQWTHSFVVAAVLAFAAGAVWGITAGLVCLAAYSAHVAVDQLGYLGSNLFFPLSSQRKPGLRLLHASDALPNLAAVWFSGLLVFWNLYAPLAGDVEFLALPTFLLYAGCLPIVAYRLLAGRPPSDPETGNRAPAARAQPNKRGVA